MKKGETPKAHEYLAYIVKDRSLVRIIFISLFTIQYNMIYPLRGKYDKVFGLKKLESSYGKDPRKTPTLQKDFFGIGPPGGPERT